MRRLIAVVLLVTLSTGCMLSRLVDRTFVGMTVQKPSYQDRKMTGLFLLPFTFVIDVATFPLQTLLVVFLGDNWPFTEDRSLQNSITMLEQDQRFQKLSDEQKKTAIAGLGQIFETGQMNPNNALALSEDGHWTVVALDPEARQQLAARLAAPAVEPEVVCSAQ